MPFIKQFYFKFVTSLFTTTFMSFIQFRKAISNLITNFFSKKRQYLGDRRQLNSVYEFNAVDPDGIKLDISEFKGKKLLIVNAASYCRYTTQYSNLETLKNKYKDTLAILIFPCNDFGRQEKGSDSEIQSFCEINYQLTIPIMKKSKIKKAGLNNIFLWLTNKTFNGWNNQQPLWNFWKFLLDEEGKLMGVFPSRVEPTDLQLTELIES